VEDWLPLVSSDKRRDNPSPLTPVFPHPVEPEQTVDPLATELCAPVPLDTRVIPTLAVSRILAIHPLVERTESVREMEAESLSML